jgi:predicted Zn-dependent protease
MSTQNAPQEIVERALASSSSLGCVVIARSRSVANLRWARNTLTTNGETVADSVSVIALVAVEGGVAAGSVTASSPTLDSVPGLVRAAEAAAVAAGPAEDAAELATGLEASSDWALAPAVSTSSAFTELAPALGEVFGAARADGIEHFGYAEESAETVYLGTSTGTRLRFTGTEGRLELTAKSHERTRSAWAGRAGRSLAGLDPLGADAELRRGLDWQARRVDVEPGRHPALLTPSAVADLVVDLYWSSIGRSAHEGRSVWSKAGGGTRIGELVVDPRVQLYSDPALAGLEATPFVTAVGSSAAGSVFDNGLPTGRVDWLRDGVLTGLITTRHTAAEAGLEFNPGVENLRLDVDGAQGGLDDLIARTQNGLLVTCLWYNRVVDPQTLLLTGLTRDGVYVVENGEVVGAATNFRFNDSPVGVLGRIEDAGSTTPTLAREMGDYFNRAAMPPLLVRDFNFSTVSQAS